MQSDLTKSVFFTFAWITTQYIPAFGSLQFGGIPLIFFLLLLLLLITTSKIVSSQCYCEMVFFLCVCFVIVEILMLIFNWNHFYQHSFGMRVFFLFCKHVLVMAVVVASTAADTMLSKAQGNTIKTQPKTLRFPYTSLFGKKEKKQ